MALNGGKETTGQASQIARDLASSLLSDPFASGEIF